MNITEFTTKNDKYKTVGTGVQTTTKIDKNWIDKVTKEVVFTIPAHSKVNVLFPEKYHDKIYIVYNNEVKSASVVNAHKWLNKFAKAPTLRTLEKRSNNGISKTVTGFICEPDGNGVDGSPSWELAIGII
jgi:hypothetical protein